MFVTFTIRTYIYVGSFSSFNMHTSALYFWMKYRVEKMFVFLLPFFGLSDLFFVKERNCACPRLSSFALGVPWELLLSTPPPTTPFSKQRKRWKQSTPWEQVGCGNCGLYLAVYMNDHSYAISIHDGAHDWAWQPSLWGSFFSGHLICHSLVG